MGALAILLNILYHSLGLCKKQKNKEGRMAPGQKTDSFIPGTCYCILSKLGRYDRPSISIVVEALFPEILENLKLCEDILQDLPIEGLEC
jgi:hypothetical protein